MKNLMTRKLLFGMLVTLVLAFSVQGIADALTLAKTSRSGDPANDLPNDLTDYRSFCKRDNTTVRFTVTAR